MDNVVNKIIKFVVGVLLSLVVRVTSSIERFKIKYKMFNKLQFSLQFVISSIASCFVVQSYLCSNSDIASICTLGAISFFIMSNKIKELSFKIILTNIVIVMLCIPAICFINKYGFNDMNMIYSFIAINLSTTLKKSIIKVTILPLILIIIYCINSNKNKNRDYSMAVLLATCFMTFYIIAGRNNLICLDIMNRHYKILSFIVAIEVLHFSLRFNLKLKTNEMIYKINKWFIR